MRTALDPAPHRAVRTVYRARDSTWAVSGSKQASGCCDRRAALQTKENLRAVAAVERAPNQRPSAACHRASHGCFHMFGGIFATLSSANGDCGRKYTAHMSSGFVPLLRTSTTSTRKKDAESKNVTSSVNANAYPFLPCPSQTTRQRFGAASCTSVTREIELHTREPSCRNESIIVKSPSTPPSASVIPLKRGPLPTCGFGTLIAVSGVVFSTANFARASSVVGAFGRGGAGRSAGSPAARTPAMSACSFVNISVSG